MTKPKKPRKPVAASNYAPGSFSEPVTRGAGFPPGFVSQIHVSPRTGRFETDFERSQRCLNSGGWKVRPVDLPGSLT